MEGPTTDCGGPVPDPNIQHEESPIIIVFDLETTGLNAKTAEIIEIAALNLKSNATFQSYACPVTNTIPDKITELTGITFDAVKDSPPPSVVAQRFFTWLRAFNCPTILVGHNAIQFDLRFLEKYRVPHTGEITIQASGPSGPSGALWHEMHVPGGGSANDVSPLYVFDTLVHARSTSFTTLTGKLRQPDIYETLFGTPPDDQHSATGDVKALGDIITRAGWTSDILTSTTANTSSVRTIRNFV